MILNVAGIVLALIVLYLVSCIRILFEYERGVVFRLGRVLEGTKGPGFIMIFWPVDSLEKVSLRIHVEDVERQDVITRDNVSVQVNAVVYFRVIDPMKAVLEVENYMYATSQLSQTTLRSIVGQVDLDDLLAEREKVNKRLQNVIDEQSDPWGIKVTLVEVKHVDLPEHMQRVMAKQAESERERRAKIIHAEGEFGAAERLRDAARLIEKHPMAMQMRFLQTLVDVGSENNSTIVFPMPIDLLRPFFMQDGKGSDPSGTAPPSSTSAEKPAWGRTPRRGESGSTPGPQRPDVGPASERGTPDPGTVPGPRTPGTGTASDRDESGPGMTPEQDEPSE